MQSPYIILVIIPDSQPASSTDVYTAFEDIILIFPLLASHLKTEKISTKCNFFCFTAILLTHQGGKRKWLL